MDCPFKCVSIFIKAFELKGVNIPYFGPPPLFRVRGGVNFDYLSRRRKYGGNMVQGVKVWCRGRSSWKGGADTFPFSYLIFSRFIIFTFRNYFTLCKIVLSISRKIKFFCHHNFMKKGHSKFSINEPENIQ